MEREGVREKEPVEREQGEHHEATLRPNAEARERARTGKIIIKENERPWRQGRQSFSKSFLSYHGVTDTAATDWTCFIHDVKRQPGKHRHQGGSSCSSWKAMGTRCGWGEG